LPTIEELEIELGGESENTEERKQTQIDPAAMRYSVD
jgi:hypothetical protein